MKTNYSTAKFACRGFRRFIILPCALIFAISILNTNVSSAQCSIDSVISTDDCGGCVGTIEIFASGGSGAYKYSIDGGLTFEACNLFTGLCAGTYSNVINDMSGCQDTSNVIIITPPLLLAFMSGSIDASCNGSCDGSLQVMAFGGTPPYAYFWNTLPIQTTDIATGLCAGAYDVAVQDTNGCWAQGFGTILEPTPIIDSTSSTNATSCGACDGTATVYASGGLPPYFYAWNTSPAQTTSTATSLCTGIYTVLVTDANGCTESATVGVGEIGGEALITSTTDVLCNGTCDGTATVSFTCGNPPCSIIWYDGSGASIGQTDTTATGLCAGGYLVQVTNNLGCISFDQVTINEPSQINATKNWTNTSCIGICDGNATVFATGGVLPYTYSWSPSGQTTQTATGLCAGMHTAIVTDSLGCSDTMMVTVGSPDTTAFNTSKIDAGCGVCNGQAITCVTGGTPPYAYSWTSGSTTFYDDSLCSGTYDVTITDANSCVASESVTIMPVNDECTGAISLTQDTICIPTACDVAGATESLFGICGIGIANDVWYSFVATSINPTIQVAGSINFSAVVELFDSCGGTFIDCAQSTSGGDTAAIMTFGLTIGNTYFIRVYDFWGSPATTTFDICIYDTPPCQDPASLFAINITDTTADLRWNSTNPGDTFIVEWGLQGFTPGSGIDTAMGTSVFGTNTVSISGLTPSTTYDFYVLEDCGSGDSTNNAGPFTFTTNAPPPANDECAGAISLTQNNSCIPTAGGVDGATVSLFGICGIGIANDVWYSFVATSINP
ncbi:MAG: hypothetical protein FVQ77_06200, partial [Cytophagales bacterium]|nr:hypothetical protein [Cytophagales bacterium]